MASFNSATGLGNCQSNMSLAKRDKFIKEHLVRVGEWERLFRT